MSEDHSKCAGHTNLEWFSEYDDNGFFFIRAEKGPSPYLFATGNDGPDAEVDARVAAAAPTMLAALLEQDRVASLRLREDETPEQAIMSARKMRRAAIAKAKGDA